MEFIINFYVHGMQLGRQPEESRRSRRSRCLRGTHGKMQMKSSHAYNRICCSSYINLSQFLCAGHKHNLCLIQPGPGLRGSLSLSIMTFCCCFVSCATADDGGSHFADHKPMIEAASPFHPPFRLQSIIFPLKPSAVVRSMCDCPLSTI